MSTKKLFEAKFPPEYEKYFALTWKMLPEIALEAKLTADTNGILVQALSPCQTVYVEIKFLKDFFTSLTGRAIGYIDLGPKSIASFPSLKKHKPKCKEIVLSVIDKYTMCYERVLKHRKQKFETILIKPPCPSYPNLSTLNGDACFCLSTSKLRSELCNLKHVDEKVEIICDGQNRTIILKAKDELSSSELEFRLSDAYEYVRTVGNCSISGIYFFEYMCSILKHVSPLFDYVLVTYSQEKPLKMKFTKLTDLLEVAASFKHAPLTSRKKMP